MLGKEGEREDEVALPTCKTSRDSALHTCLLMICQPGKMDDNTIAALGIAALWDERSQV